MEFDRDGDGKLNRDELMEFARSMPSPGGPGPGGPGFGGGLKVPLLSVHVVLISKSGSIY
jgi:hypothetical protein